MQLTPGEQEHPSVRVVSPALSDGRLCWLLWEMEVAVSCSSLDVGSEGSLALPLLGHRPGLLQLCYWHTEELAEGTPSTCLWGSASVPHPSTVSGSAPGIHKSEAEASLGWEVDRLWVPGRLCYSD